MIDFPMLEPEKIDFNSNMLMSKENLVVEIDHQKDIYDLRDVLVLSDRWITDSAKYLINSRTLNIHKVLEVSVYYGGNTHSCVKVTDQDKVEVGDFLTVVGRNDWRVSY